MSFAGSWRVGAAILYLAMWLWLALAPSGATNSQRWLCHMELREEPPIAFLSGLLFWEAHGLLTAFTPPTPFRWSLFCEDVRLGPSTGTHILSTACSQIAFLLFPLEQNMPISFQLHWFCLFASPTFLPLCQLKCNSQLISTHTFPHKAFPDLPLPTMVFPVWSSNHYSLSKKKKSILPKNILGEAIKVINFIKYWPLGIYRFNTVCELTGSV